MRYIQLLLWALPAQTALGREEVYNPYYEQLRASELLGSHFGVPGTSATFDYVVVGGGTAGLTVAYRLAQNPSLSIAVIEAGGLVEFDNGNRTSVPGFASSVLGPPNPLVDWVQYTNPQEGLSNRSLHYIRGKTLSGSSSLNAMWYQRGSAGSYSQWAEAVEDSSYQFANFLPYFKKSIHFTPPDATYVPHNVSIEYNLSASGSQGLLQVGYARWINAISSWFQRASQELGHLPTDGFLDGKLIGHQYTAFTIDSKTQTRSTSETAFLRQALLELPNLTIYKTTLAKQILFGENKKATSVLVNTAGLNYEITATHEIILSAGAFRSPQLLQVSGVGDEKLLTELGIPVIKNLPGVGQNLQDNLLFGPAYEVNVVSHELLLTDPTFLAQAVENYTTSRTGILTNTFGDFISYEKLPAHLLSNSTQAALDAAFPSDWPHVELTPFDESFGPTPAGRNFFTSIVIVLATFSRGTVTINTTDTAANPIVDFAYLTDARDRDVAIAAFKQARAYAKTKAMRNVIIGEEFSPGLAVATDAQILDYIMQTATPLSHASCTCSMGKAGDPMAVVDAQGRVFGVGGLRVIDASSFPLLPPGQPQATVYALAEKLAEAILGEL